MKKLSVLTLLLISQLLSHPAYTDTVKIGTILGFTGPIESLTPAMADSAEIAWKEISDSGLFLGGKKIQSIRVDSTCIDSAVAVANAEKLVSSENVVAIYGADCSGVTTSIINSVTVPNGVVNISPSATAPALSDIDDRGYFFRTAPSDARQGQVLAKIVKNRGINKIAVTYTNSDYGKGLSETFRQAYEALGGTVLVSNPHDDGKADYSAEVAALAASGAEYLAVFGYADQGGKGIMRASLDTDAFVNFVFADGMVGDSLLKNFGNEIGGAFGTKPGAVAKGATAFDKIAAGNGKSTNGPFRGESYDAAALIALAMHAGGKANREIVKDNMMKVANAPGEKIYPGELKKALEILNNGGDIDYQGAVDVEFNNVGEVEGTYLELEINKGAFKTITSH